MKSTFFSLIVSLVLSGLSLGEENQVQTAFFEQDVACISIAHLSDGAELVFFWDMIQGEWSCLDHRWVGSNMQVFCRDGKWYLNWHDDSENCDRLVSTDCWVESWETENPLSDQNQRPWFRQLLNPGLKNRQK